MTLQLRKKHPITRPSSSRPTPLSRIAALVVAALIALIAVSQARAELQWNRPTRGAAQPAVAANAKIQLAAHETPAAPRDAQPGTTVRVAAQFDPFESAPADDALGVKQAAQQSDPFEEDDIFAGFGLPGDDEPAATDDEPAEPEVATDAADESDSSDDLAADDSEFDPFDEPVAPTPTTPAEELEAADQAIEEELQRRESDRAMESELPSGDEGVDAETVPGVERELPSFDSEQFDSHLDEMPYDWRQDDAEPNSLTPEQEQRRREQIALERQQASEDCAELRSIARRRKINDISLDIALHGDAGQDYPFECSLGSETFAGRAWPQVTYRWKAAALCHKPLYFEQVQLERYGHSWGPYVQPLVSGAHFFASIPLLPYKMGIRTPNECVYTLGYYRPGSCAPYMIEAFPFTWRAAMFEGFIATGTAFVIP
ncbi:MAG: hypothetical protein KDA44_20440 [Planctomycetales bacterium]|nr:hypothetical protein [Planctomycetales bacterium]